MSLVLEFARNGAKDWQGFLARMFSILVLLKLLLSRLLTSDVVLKRSYFLGSKFVGKLRLFDYFPTFKWGQQGLCKEISKCCSREYFDKVSFVCV